MVDERLGYFVVVSSPSFAMKGGAMNTECGVKFVLSGSGSICLTWASLLSAILNVVDCEIGKTRRWTVTTLTDVLQKVSDGGRELESWWRIKIQSRRELWDLARLSAWPMRPRGCVSDKYS